MIHLTRRALGAGGLALLATRARAAEAIKWLHVEVNPQTIAIWNEAAHAFEAGHPGVSVQPQYLENEAYKAKLTTLLQSPDKPSMFYSWAGGVLRAQVEAGVLEDLTDQVKGYGDTLTPSALAAFTVNGRIWGIPYALNKVGIFYNKALFAKAGVDSTKVKTWDDLLDAVKKLQAAGITPLTTGGADKWPLALIYDYLCLRQGGKAGFQAAMRGENGGFAGPDFVKAGTCFRQLADLKPFQPGFLGAKYLPATGLFADGKVAMTVAISVVYNVQRAVAADKKGLDDDTIGWIDFPMLPGGKGVATETLGGIVGWLVSKGAPKPTAEFLKSFVSMDAQQKLAAGGYIVPVVKGADQAIASPFIRNVAAELARSTYHQNYYDQELGPAVGRVVNDVSAEIAGGTMTGEDAAKAIEAARKQGN